MNNAKAADKTSDRRCHSILNTQKCKQNQKLKCVIRGGG
jgi:hypothetical protein